MKLALLGWTLTVILVAGCAEDFPAEQAEPLPNAVVPLENPLPDEAFSGNTSAAQPQIFFAEDISAAAGQQFEEVLDLAVSSWGNYGPTEIYVVGIEEDEAEALHERFCERRRYSDDRCEDLYSTNEGMGYYQEIAESTGDLAGTEAQWVAQWEQGYHLLIFSRPHGLEQLLDWPLHEDQATIFHEYWHVVQSAHISNAELKALGLSAGMDERDPDWDEDYDWSLYNEFIDETAAREGPLWFVEGSADFMSYLEVDRLVADNRLPSNSSIVSWEEEMSWKMGEGLANELSPGVPLEQSMGYHLGAWATAYLLNLTDEDVLLEEFYPQMMDYPNWEENFQVTFGLSSEDFYAQFADFLKLPYAEQEKILIFSENE